MATLNTLGNLFESILQLHAYVRIGALIIADNFRYLAFILSTPVDMEVSSVFNWRSTNFTVTIGLLNFSMFKRLVFSVFMWESLGVYVIDLSTATVW